MKVRLNPDSPVSAVIVDGQKIVPGEVATISKKDFQRLAAPYLGRPRLLEVVEEESGGGEPSDGESQEDN